MKILLKFYFFPPTLFEELKVFILAIIFLICFRFLPVFDAFAFINSIFNSLTFFSLSMFVNFFNSLNFIFLFSFKFHFLSSFFQVQDFLTWLLIYLLILHL